MMELSILESTHYTLSEACDYLNIKNKTNIFSSERLLNNISKYEIPIYAYLKGDIVRGIFRTNVPSNDDKELNHIIITSIMENTLSEIFKDGKVLFELHHSAIKSLLLDKHIDIYDREKNPIIFINMINVPDGGEESDILTNINNLIIKPKYGYYVTETIILYPTTKKTLPHDLNQNSKEQLVEEQDLIDFTHLIIVHKDLILLERRISSLLGNKLTDCPHKKLTQGISPIKKAAKEKAKELAKEFWEQDINNEIRMKDMAINVFVALKESEYADQLPNHTSSIKSWISDIAPPYAKKAGRPKKS